MTKKNKKLLNLVFINIILSFFLIVPIIKSYGLTKGFWLDLGGIISILPFYFFSLIFGSKFVFDQITNETFHYYSFIFYLVLITLIWFFSIKIKIKFSQKNFPKL